MISSVNNNEKTKKMEKPKDLIFILEEQLKFIKMTVTEREYLQNTINKLKEAINYTPCCKSDSEQLCEHPMSERADIVGSYRTYCLKCSTTL